MQEGNRVWWYAVQVKSGQEFELCEIIAEEHAVLEAFSPAYHKHKKKSRHTNAVVQEKHPLFSKFIFVKFHSLWRPWNQVTKHRGVEGFLSIGAAPLPIRDVEISVLRRDCDAGVYNDKGIAGAIQKGDKVEIKYDGTQWSPFIGLGGEFQKLSEKGNAIIELSIFGRSTKLEIPTGMIEKVL